MGEVRHRVVMITTSYPRFPGDTVGTFMEPIAHGVARLGHDVHVVLPAHPHLQRPAREGNVWFHPFRYAPFRALQVFGYAAGLKADVRLRPAAFAAAPLALAASWLMARRVARDIQATIVHAHWVIPSGAVAAVLPGSRPLVISLHGSDVFVAERHRPAATAARTAFRHAGFVTACSEDLLRRAIALGADAARSEVVPYGVDADRFRPDAGRRAVHRARLAIPDGDLLVVAAGRLVRKKGFEYLIDAMPGVLERAPRARLVIGGGGDLEAELRARAAARGIADRVVLTGVLEQDEVGALLAAADVAVVPSVRDDAGNVDGLPNVVMETLASGTALVATPAGGIASVARDGDNALLVPERDARALAGAILRVLTEPGLGAHLGERARRDVIERHSWDRHARRLVAAYETAARPGRNGTASLCSSA